MSIFTLADVALLKQDRLLRVANNLFPDLMPSDEFLLFKMQAEEASLEARFRTSFGEREVILTDSDRTSFPVGTLFIEEPGYDYDPQLFRGEAWGLICLHHTPVVAIHSIRFAYPRLTDTLYQVPTSWIRYERKTGQINLVPSTETVVDFPANAFILSALSGGRTIPFMIQIAYRVGMPNIRTERPDIIDAILKCTVLSIIDDQYLPASGSDSIDGLSQSMSFDFSKHREMLDARLDRIASSLSGIDLVVC